MSFGSGKTFKLDVDLQNFIEAEKQSSRFKVFLMKNKCEFRVLYPKTIDKLKIDCDECERAVFELNDICWDRCMHKIEPDFSKVKGCFINCVERFLDATNFILNRSQETFRKTIT